MPTARTALSGHAPDPPSAEMRRLLGGALTSEESVQLIRWLHRLGKGSLAQHPEEKMLHSDLVRETKRLGLKVEQLRKTRDFARKYTSSDLSTLCDQINEKKTPIGFAHIIRLLSVPADQRDRLQKRVLMDKWSAVRLGREIRLRFGQRRKGARKPTAPTSPHDLIGQILGHCDRWCRWYGTVNPPAASKDIEPPKSYVSGLDKAAQQQLDQITALFNKLQSRYGKKPPSSQ